MSQLWKEQATDKYQEDEQQAVVFRIFLEWISFWWLDCCQDFLFCFKKCID